jgi:hypothetical protein
MVGFYFWEWLNVYNTYVEEGASIDSTNADIWVTTRNGQEIKVLSVEYQLVVEREPIYSFGDRLPAYFTPRRRRFLSTLYLEPSAFRGIMATQDFFNIHIKPHESKYEVVVPNVSVTQSRQSTTWNGYICDCISEGHMEEKFHIPKNPTNKSVKDLLLASPDEL